jgi:hypothetical protein
MRNCLKPVKLTGNIDITIDKVITLFLHKKPFVVLYATTERNLMVGAVANDNCALCCCYFNIAVSFCEGDGVGKKKRTSKHETEDECCGKRHKKNRLREGVTVEYATKQIQIAKINGLSSYRM